MYQPYSVFCCSWSGCKSISSFPLSRFLFFSFLLQQRKNFWSAAGKSGQRLRIRRQHWKSFPTSAVWKDSCWEACLCMARKTSSLHLDWLVFYCSLVTSWCRRTKGFILIIPQINLPCLQVTVTRETIQSEIQTYLLPQWKLNFVLTLFCSSLDPPEQPPDVHPQLPEQSVEHHGEPQNWSLRSEGCEGRPGTQRK